MQWYVDAAPALIRSVEVPRRFEVTASYSDPRRPVRGSAAPIRYSDKFVWDIAAYSEASVDANYDYKMWMISMMNESRIDAMNRTLTSIADSLEGTLALIKTATPPPPAIVLEPCGIESAESATRTVGLIRRKSRRCLGGRVRRVARVPRQGIRGLPARRVCR